MLPKGTRIVVILAICVIMHGAAAQGFAPSGEVKSSIARSTPPALTLSSFDQEVLDLLEKGENDRAEKLLLSIAKKAEGEKKAEALVLSSCLDFQAERFGQSLGKLKRALKVPIAEDKQEAQRAFETKWAGDCCYRLHKIDQAVESYQRALLLAKPEALKYLRMDILESLSGCLIAKGEYAEAKKYAEELVASCRDLPDDADLATVATQFWSEISLMQIYKHLGDSANYQELRSSFIPLLQRLIRLRNELEAPLTTEKRLALPLQLNSFMLSEFLAGHGPKSLAEYLWLVSTYHVRGLPLISWEAPEGCTPKAAILCVHAFGLDNRAFEWFAAQMKDRHFVIYALDIRGFGAWQSETGSGLINFDQALSDIRSVGKIIKELSPGVPVFLLGESMGGALVLRAASDPQCDFNGVIASVPSPDRYGESRMALRVAMHLLRQPNKVFNIGDQLATQATSNEELRTMWETDPFSRHEFSPLELMKLNRFMVKALQDCSHIKSTPVIIVQGLADRLVKPKGTYEMFDRVNSTDKAMIILGAAEHLIFETTNQSSVLLDGLTAWLNGQISKQKN